MAFRWPSVKSTRFFGSHVDPGYRRDVPRPLKLEGDPSKQVLVKVPMSLRRKRAAADIAAGSDPPLDLGTWCARVIYAEIDRLRPPRRKA